MKHLERAFKRKHHSCVVLAAFPAAGNRLMIALDVIDDASDKYEASCIVEVNLEDPPSYKLIYESDKSARDYAYDDKGGWHGLLQDAGIVELEGGTTRVTPIGEGSLVAIARVRSAVVGCGRQHVGKVEKGRFTKIATKPDNPNGFSVVHFATPDRGYLGGPWGTFFMGSASGFAPVKLPDATFATAPDKLDLRHEILALHEKEDGSVMIGCRDAAMLYAKGKCTKLEGGGIFDQHVRATIEHRGVEYWGMEDTGRDVITLLCRSGATLAAKFTAPYKPIHYRRRPHPGLRIKVRDDVMAVAIRDRVHLYDGKKWTQLNITTDVKSLVKRVPSTMKRK